MRKVAIKSVLAIVMLIGLCSGNVMAQINWKKCFGGTSHDMASVLIPTNDWGYIIAGETQSNDGDVSGLRGVTDIWIAKLDTARNVEWQKCLGGSYVEDVYAVKQTSDGGYILAGYTYSLDGDVSGRHNTVTDSSDYWIVKLDASGNLQWQKCLGGSGNEYATDVIETAEGNYLVTGYTQSTDGDVTGNHGGTDAWLVLLDNNGNIRWQKCYGGTRTDYINTLLQTADGGYTGAGSSLSNDGDVSGNHGGYDSWIIKIDSIGNLQWQKCYGGMYWEYIVAIRQTADGGYITGGHTESNNGNVSGNHGDDDYWIFKTDSAGNLQWQKCLGGTNEEILSSLIITADGGYSAIGRSKSTNGDVTGQHGTTSVYDYWIVKLNASGTLQWQKCLGGYADDYGTSVLQTITGSYMVAGSVLSNDGDVTGNKGNTDIWLAKFSAGQPMNFNVSVNRTFVNCTDPNSGKITVGVSGGTAPYKYKWSNGGTSSTASGLAVGNYTVTVTDNWGNYYTPPQITMLKQRCGATLGVSPINVPFNQMPGAIIPRP